MPVASPRVSLPRTRAGGLWAWLVRGAWILPTNVVGHLAGVIVSGSLGQSIVSPYARARVYEIALPGFDWVGAVTLGHAILMHSRYQGGHRQLVLAHELAHTRQHDWLGPLYLPLHILLQVVSALRFRVRPVPGESSVHIYNPLEERYLFLPHHVLRALVRERAYAREDVRVLLGGLGLNEGAREW